MQVDIYRNLRNKDRNRYSILDRATGRIIGHADYVFVRKARFVVRPAGRERVRRERKKYVHAFVRGELESAYSRLPRSRDQQIAEHRHDRSGFPVDVRYNPYVNDTFVDSITTQPVEAALFALLTPEGVHATVY